MYAIVPPRSPPPPSSATHPAHKNMQVLVLRWSTAVLAHNLIAIWLLVCNKAWCAGLQHQILLLHACELMSDLRRPHCGFQTFIPGIVFMRGHSVGILIILTAEETGERFTVLTIQPRLPVPNYNSVEIPAASTRAETSLADTVMCF